jgi:enoyl-CoA hydratase/carnithine racemase
MNGRIEVAERGTIVRLTIDRPAQRNALTPELIDGLIDELERAEADASARVLVLTGAGGSFCAGYDLNLLRSPGTEDAGAERDHVERLCSRVRGLRIPTIAAVDGVASGAGCDLAVSCDVRIATEEARFSMPPARLGLLYSHEGIERLRDLVGPAFAKEMLLSGELVGAERALGIGLVNRVVPVSALDADVRRLAEVVATNAPLSVAASKRIVDGAPPDAVAELQRTVWMSDDAREGPQAFRERRTPRFDGR